MPKPPKPANPPKTPTGRFPAKPQSPRVVGGPVTHLSDEARALIIERIIAGDTNARINGALRLAKFLQSGESVSKTALTEYRKSDAVKVNKEQLTEEARQAGHAALSAALVYAVESLHAGASGFLDVDNGAFLSMTTNDDVQKAKLAAMVHFKAADFLWNHLGMKDVLSAIEDGERQALESINKADVDESIKRQLEIMVRENSIKQLRLITEKQREIAVAVSVAPSVPVAPTPIAPGASA